MTNSTINIIIHIWLIAGFSLVLSAIFGFLCAVIFYRLGWEIGKIDGRRKGYEEAKDLYTNPKYKS